MSTRQSARISRKSKKNKSLFGSETKPRLCIFRSLKYTYAQLISDDSGKVLAAVNTKSFDAKSKKNVDAAKTLGLKIAELAKAQKIKKVVFDRNGYLYHGRVAAVAEGAREGGLEF